MGFPRGPPPGFLPKYSQVMATREEQIYSPPSGNARYGNGEGFPTGNLVIPNQSLNGFPGTEVVVPGEPEGNPTSPDNESQVPNEPETNDVDHAMPDENEVPKESGIGSGDAITDTNVIPEGWGQGGMMHDILMISMILTMGILIITMIITMGILRILMIQIMQILFILMTLRQKLKHSDSS